MSAKHGSDCIYHLKIHLIGISPMIYRRFQIKGDTNIAELHYIIQIVMGWQDLHLNCFRIRTKEYGVYHDGGIMFSDNPIKVLLADLNLLEGEKFRYDYDFGDDWIHELRIEKIVEPNATFNYPKCTFGKLACPPEDVGGIYGYEQFKEKLRGLQFELLFKLAEIVSCQGEEDSIEALQMVKELREFVESSQEELMEESVGFDPELFNRREVNQRLKKLYQKKGSSISTLDSSFWEARFD
ncbi:MAG: hypothetical protein ACI9J3_003971 [Parvicellaceae bacterium]|jgi:hypothetical protein